MATYAFYGLNGYRLTGSDTDLVHLILDTIVEHWPVEKIAQRLQQCATPIPDEHPLSLSAPEPAVVDELLPDQDPPGHDL